LSPRRHQFQLDHAFNGPADETKGSQRRFPQRLGGRLGKLGFTRTGENQAFNLGSLPKYYDSTHRRYLQGLGLQRAVASYFENLASGYSLEVRIFELQSPTQARKGQHQLSICLAHPTELINTQRIYT